MKSEKAEPGDKVKIVTDQETLEGTLLPSPREDTLMLKLSSGYNLGLLKKNVKSISLVQKRATPKEKETALTQKSGLPMISLIHTGGTVASKVDYSTGAVYSRFSPEEILTLVPELANIANIRSVFLGNMFSGDMNFNHYNKIAEAVAKEIKEGTSGVIITHGTDTLAYSAASISFILDNLGIPVLYVGAQRSSDRGSSDSAFNLICAAQFLTKSDFGEVGICMHSNSGDKSCSILPATKSRKLHTSRRDAFKAVNTTPWATVTKEGNITLLNKNYQKKDPTKKLTLKLIDPNITVGYYKFHPGMRAEELSFYKNYDGLLLEGTGLGNGPVNVIDEYTKGNQKILDELAKLTKKMPVVMTSQCLFGRVDMNVYSYGRKIQEAGVVGNLADMVPETAYVKLAWLLSNHKNNEIAGLITKNLRGEISERSEVQEDYLSG